MKKKNEYLEVRMSLTAWVRLCDHLSKLRTDGGAVPAWVLNVVLNVNRAAKRKFPEIYGGKAATK